MTVPLAVVDRWSDEAVRSEWHVDAADLDDDLLAWGNGMRMADQDEYPAQRFNEAEYMTRGLKHTLIGDCPLPDGAQIHSITRILRLLDNVPAHVVDTMGEFMPKLARLALHITRDRGWQPPALGGDGRVPVDPSSPIVLAALACTSVPPERSVEGFFQRPIS